MISEVPAPFRGPFSIFLWRPFPVALSFRAFRPRRLSVPLFSLWVEELSFLDMRASSPLIYFSAFASTSAMLA